MVWSVAPEAARAVFFDNQLRGQPGALPQLGEARRVILQSRWLAPRPGGGTSCQPPPVTQFDLDQLFKELLSGGWTCLVALLRWRRIIILQPRRWVSLPRMVERVQLVFEFAHQRTSDGGITQGSSRRVAVPAGL